MKLVEIFNEFIEIDEDKKISTPPKNICELRALNIQNHGLTREQTMKIIEGCPLILLVKRETINRIWNEISQDGKYPDIYIITQIINYPSKLINNLSIV